jgi:hypothetical protein
MRDDKIKSIRRIGKKGEDVGAGGRKMRRFDLTNPADLLD